MKDGFVYVGRRTVADAIIEGGTLNKFHLKVEWARARLLGDLSIRKAGQYVPWGKTPNGVLWQLGLKLSRWSQQKMAIANDAVWNKRNLNPHLP
jgi:hypothetical protein